MSRRIALIAPSRSPIAQPFSGGLAAHVWSLCISLRKRGLEVTLFAAPGSDPRLPVVELALDRLQLSGDARVDVSMPPEIAIREHHAYLSLMLRLAADPRRFDVIHNHSLHYLPLAMAGLVETPMITTLHTPPTAWLESAVQCGPPPPVRFVTVSEYTARRWRPLLSEVDVIPNGIDLDDWPSGDGGPDTVWTGRIVPEKAPHLAILAARQARRRIVLAGPIGDPDYFCARVEPLLGTDAVYAGHLERAQLSALVRASCVALVTPMWDEPYGLVVAEALASGTPVAGFERGGIPEVVDESCARLVTGGDVAALSEAIAAAARLSRGDARAHAEKHCSIESMMDSYELLIDETVVA